MLRWNATFLKTGDRHLPGASEIKFCFTEDNQRVYPVELLCAVLEVSASGYYAWLARGLYAAAKSCVGVISSSASHDPRLCRTEAALRAAPAPHRPSPPATAT